MKIAIIGANGQLGRDVCRAFNNRDEVFEVNHDRLDIVNIDDSFRILKQIDPHLVINTAAMHNVDACEADPTQSFIINGIGARNLAIASRDLGFTLMHISTDYVFDGLKQKPYVESDCPKPLNVYGNTKLSGEYFIQSIADKYFILRVSAIYGENQCRAKGGLNFVGLMLKLAKERDEVRVVNDEFVSPTYTRHIANQIVRLSNTAEYGLYHVSSQGCCSWYSFAAKIFELTKATVKLCIAEPGEFPTKVDRPKYSVLENRALQHLGIDTMPHWEAALKNHLSTIGAI